jgi:hypothetical protein
MVNTDIQAAQEFIQQWWVFLVPLLLLQVGLTLASLIHVLTHHHFKVGNKLIWLLVSFISIIGPVLYFVVGREDSGGEE